MCAALTGLEAVARPAQQLLWAVMGAAGIGGAAAAAVAVAAETLATAVVSTAAARQH